MQLFAQSVDKRNNRVVGFPQYRTDCARVNIGLGDYKRRRRCFKIMGFDDAIPYVRRQLDENHHGSVTSDAVAVVNQRTLKIQLSPCRAANKVARETATGIQSLHKETFRGGQAIEEGQRQTVLGVDGKRNRQLVNFGADHRHPLITVVANRAGLHVFTVQWHQLNGHVAEHGGAEALQHNVVPAAVSIVIQATATAA